MLLQDVPENTTPILGVSTRESLWTEDLAGWIWTLVMVRLASVCAPQPARTRQQSLAFRSPDSASLGFFPPEGNETLQIGSRG